MLQRKKYSARRACRGLLTERLELRNLLAADLGFTPLPSSIVVGSLPETAPFALAGEWSQSVLESQSTLGPGESMPVGSDGASWNDMLAINESGPDAGRYLFRAHELFTSLGGNAGISRTDLVTGHTVTIAQRADFDAMDPVYWTPWGTVITGEESANLPAQFRDPAYPDSVNGLVYEILNPLAMPEDIQIVARPAVGSMAHEGIQFDAAGNVYVIDEFNGGGIYKFVPTTWGDLSSGQLFVLKDRDGGDGADLGPADWVALNDATGNPLEGITDPRINGRQAANDVGATDYLRPEDLQMSRLANGNEVLYVATTTDNRVLSIEFAVEGPVIRNFVTRQTPLMNPDGSIGAAVDTRLNSPDNLAIDGQGRIFIVEDFSPSDIWGTVDADNDGVAETVGLFASLSTTGAEATGLTFNPFNPNEAWVNVQHSASDNDATITLRKVDAAAGVKVLNGVLSVYGTEGHDDIDVKRQGRNTAVTVNGALLGRFQSAGIGQVLVDADLGDDSVDVTMLPTMSALVYGNGGNDVLFTSTGRGVVSGGAGNDQASGGVKSDELHGNAGNDLLMGGDAADLLFGGDGDDILFGNNGHDSMFGGAGNDFLFGGSGNDWLNGEDGFDWLYGQAGADMLMNGERIFH